VPAELWRLAPNADRKALAREIASGVGGYVSGFDEVFDAGGFLIAPERLAGLDPVFLFTLHAAREALRSAGMEIGVPHERGMVVLGNLGYPTPGLVDFALEVWGEGPRTVDARNRFQSGLPAQLVARALGFHGGAFAVDAACASSLYAIKLACDGLHALEHWPVALRGYPPYEFRNITEPGGFRQRRNCDLVPCWAVRARRA
jgi:acyl transferase domain-containing protein